ncbi:hypothetical protein PVAP13_5KG010812 [Panicum virgatum]|uniref:Uncharacterized protein n=1 Tax=Panicum virgatum TaxID=38727 RepID=A0A8T0SEB6_PANVG|nr:hypothetical protein PVAP13_5KG010812 [Panicum virgatum]
MADDGGPAGLRPAPTCAAAAAAAVVQVPLDSPHNPPCSCASAACPPSLHCVLHRRGWQPQQCRFGLWIRSASWPIMHKFSNCRVCIGKACGRHRGLVYNILHAPVSESILLNLCEAEWSS